jgi:hypothetical protein
MKNVFFSFLFILITTNAYTQNMPQFLLGAYYDREITFGISLGNRITEFKNVYSESELYESSFQIIKENGFQFHGTKIHSGSYYVIEENGLTYLVILWDDKTWNKYLMIVYETSHPTEGTWIDYIKLYNEDGYPFFDGAYTTGEEYGPSIGYSHVNTAILSASSVLQEENTVYSTDNLDERIGICWALNGNGIGEKLIFEHDTDTKGGRSPSFSHLYISTGFVSIEKPHLWRENARPRKIRISEEGENPCIVELDDTPHLQLIDERSWSPPHDKKDLWIEILEVYPGTKYTDTCVNYIGWYLAQ